MGWEAFVWAGRRIRIEVCASAGAGLKLKSWAFPPRGCKTGHCGDTAKVVRVHSCVHVNPIKKGSLCELMRDTCFSFLQNVGEREGRGDSLARLFYWQPVMSSWWVIGIPCFSTSSCVCVFVCLCRPKTWLACRCVDPFTGGPVIYFPLLLHIWMK